MGKRRLGSRWLLGAVMAAAAGGAGCDRSEAMVEAPKESASPPAPKVAPKPSDPFAGIAVGATLEETRAKLNAVYGIAPDRRFLAAAGTEQEPAKAVSTPEGWTVTHGGKTHALPRFPAFEELMTLAVSASTGARFNDGSWLVTAEDALSDLEDPATATLAQAQASISLVHWLVDRYEVSDTLFIDALRTLKKAETEAGAPLGTERAVLARALGYWSAAERLATDMPAGPLRSYLMNDEAALKAATATSPEARVLWFRFAFEKGRPDVAKAAIAALAPGQFGTLSTLAARLAADDFELQGENAFLCRPALEVHVAAAAEDKNAEATLEGMAQAKTDLELFVLALGRGIEAAKSQVADAGVELEAVFSPLKSMETSLGKLRKEQTARRAYLQALITSCVATQVRFYFDKRAEKPVYLKAFAEGMQELELGEFRRLQELTQLLATAARTRDDGKRLLKSLKTLQGVGGSGWLRAFEGFVSTTDYTSPSLRTASQLLVPHLDSRPHQLRQAVNALPEALGDKVLNDEMWAAWAAAAGARDPRALAWWRRYSAVEPYRDPEDRKLRLADAVEDAKAALDPTRDDWTERAGLVRKLREADRDKEAAAVIAEWRTRYPADLGFGGQWALCQLAEIQLEQGNVAAASKLFAPVKASYKRSTLETGARIAIASKDWTTAKLYADRALERYPTSPEALALRMEVAWHEGDYEKAASVSATAEKAPSGWDYSNHFFPAFTRAFRDKKPEEAQAAMLALFKGSKIDAGYLLNFPDGLRNEGKYEHVLSALNVLNPGGDRQLRVFIEQYNALRHVKGAEFAAQWINKQVPENARGVLGQLAYAADRDPLQWDIEPPHMDTHTSHTDFAWLLRAAATLRQHWAVRPELKARFETDASPTKYHTLGRYLMGYADLDQVMKYAKDAKDLTEITYYLGLKALSDGHFSDASVWYRACLEAAATNNDEYNWSARQLTQWTSNSMNAEELANYYAKLYAGPFTEEAPAAP